MATTASVPEKAFSSKLGAKLDKKPSRVGVAVFVIVLTVGLGYVGTELVGDLARAPRSALFPYVLLGIALLIALAFEFVNGFHDTANAVATVIYTHSLEPNVAVMWSGAWNFVGVLVSSFCRWGAEPDSPWCLRSSRRRSCGISGRGGSGCRPRVRTRSSDR
jgi:inorganic phosphate transporter, PiT family